MADEQPVAPQQVERPLDGAADRQVELAIAHGRGVRSDRPADVAGIGVPAESLASGLDAGGLLQRVLHQCDDCQALWPEAELEEARRPWARPVDEGAAPTGACPACGAPCYPTDRIDGVSAGGRAERLAAEMGGVMGAVHVRPATSGPCETESLDTPDHVPDGTSDVAAEQQEQP